MDPELQYLAPLQEMLRAEHPELLEAIQSYLRLRAIQVAWNHPANDDGVKEEKLHAEYLKAYQIAVEAQKRFFATNDRLSRLMKRDNFTKELAKFKEHILDPMAFYEKERMKLREKWIYGRPNHVDLINLRDILTETFLEATSWLSLQGK